MKFIPVFLFLILTLASCDEPIDTGSSESSGKVASKPSAADAAKDNAGKPKGDTPSASIVGKTASSASDGNSDNSNAAKGPKSDDSNAGKGPKSDDSNAAKGPKSDTSNAAKGPKSDDSNAAKGPKSDTPNAAKGPKSDDSNAAKASTKSGGSGEKGDGGQYYDSRNQVDQSPYGRNNNPHYEDIYPNRNGGRDGWRDGWGQTGWGRYENNGQGWGNQGSGWGNQGQGWGNQGQGWGNQGQGWGNQGWQGGRREGYIDNNGMYKPYN